MKFALVVVLLICAAGNAHAQTRHPCAADAIKRATPLLKLHFEYTPDQTPQNFSIGETVKVLPPIRALRGNRRLDVLEVWGYIYKAEYRMRFLYAQGEGCALFGQEILENSSP